MLEKMTSNGSVEMLGKVWDKALEELGWGYKWRKNTNERHEIVDAIKVLLDYIKGLH